MLARGFAPDPEVFLLDEPTADLDPAAMRPARIAAPPMRRVIPLGGRRVRPSGRGSGIRLALLVSGGGHALIAAVLLAGLLLGPRKLPKPDELPQIEVLLGTDAHASGSQESAKQPAQAAPPAEPTPPAALPPPPPVPATAAAPPTEPPPPQPPAPAPAPTLPAQTAGLLPPPPPPAPPPPAPPVQAQPPPPAPPPVQTVAARPPAPQAVTEPPPAVRLGDGAVGSIGEINAGPVVHRAEADTGNRLPNYPADAAHRGEHGLVVVHVTVGVDGSVTKVELAESSGSPSLDQAALDRMATWHFKPAMRDGLPQVDVLTMGVNFKLD